MHSMKFTILFLVLSSMVMYSESALILAGIIAVKAAIVGAFIIGGIAGGIAGSAARNNRGRGHGHGRGRHGRSIADVDEMFLVPIFLFLLLLLPKLSRIYRHMNCVDGTGKMRLFYFYARSGTPVHLRYCAGYYVTQSIFCKSI
jgi:F0F1-type ATP synthase membrane subunit c/vacuolar-type H+-ATPase subunit K